MVKQVLQIITVKQVLIIEANRKARVSQTLFGNPKGTVELGNPNTGAETKLFYSGSRSSLL